MRENENQDKYNNLSPRFGVLNAMHKVCKMFSYQTLHLILPFYKISLEEDVETPMLVNFTCSLIGQRGVQKAGETFSLGVSVRVFLQEISIWISRLNKKDCQSSHQSNWDKGLHNLLSLEYLLPSDLSSPGSQTIILWPGLIPLTTVVLGPLDLDSNCKCPGLFWASSL